MRPRPDLVQIAEIVGAHGPTGAFKLRCFTEDPMTVMALNPMRDVLGREIFDIDFRASVQDGIVVGTKAIASRGAAEKLIGMKLFAPKDRLPPPDDDEYFANDLIGLVASDQSGTVLGRVVAVLDFGAGDILEIEPEHGESLLVPFSVSTVPTIDMEASALTLCLPEEIDA